MWRQSVGGEGRWRTEKLTAVERLSTSASSCSVSSLDEESRDDTVTSQVYQQLHFA
jgi:hypothetical protein